MPNPDFWTSPAVTIAGGVATVAAPTSIAQGFDLGGRESVRVIISTDLGATLSFSGASEAILFWLWSFALQRWVPNNRLQIPLSTADAGARDATFEDQFIGVPYGRIFAGPSNVTASGGNGGKIFTTIEGA